jgi:hypothetical protein
MMRARLASSSACSARWAPARLPRSRLEGREERFELPREVVALAVDGCDVFVALTASDAGGRDGVYRLSPGP